MHIKKIENKQKINDKLKNIGGVSTIISKLNIIRLPCLFMIAFPN